MKKYVYTLVCGLVLSGCDTVPVPDFLSLNRGSQTLGGVASGDPIDSTGIANAEVNAVNAGGQSAPQAPNAAADTAEEFDTTTFAQRAEATTVTQTAKETPLGRTVASLGAPTEPGFWLKTPLVTSERQGRVEYPATGRSVNVTLIPIDGPTTAGSRLSLPALRLLGAPLTGLPEVEVFVNPDAS